MNSIKNNTLKITYAALFLALGMALPFLTGQIPEIGNMLLPMHISVMLCGLICGPLYGLGIGALTPILRSLIFTMPPLMPTAFSMAFELATYGFVIGLMYKKLHGKRFAVYVSLLVTMILGRIMWGLVSIYFYGLVGKTFTYAIFFAGAFLNAIPGIILQFVLIPVIIKVVKNFKREQQRKSTY